jgi:metal-responsive CopG/Arc/MetJ family transcriptional regulator
LKKVDSVHSHQASQIAAREIHGRNCMQTFFLAGNEQEIAVALAKLKEMDRVSEIH